MKNIVKKSKIYKFFHNLNYQIQAIDKKIDNFERNNFIENISIQLNELKKENEELKRQLYNITTNLDSANNHNVMMNNNIYDRISEVKLLNNIVIDRTRQLECFNSELLLLNKNNNLKKVLIVGFYGAPNLGDELMLEAILKKLTNFNNIEITIMIADNPNYDISKYGNVNFIHYAKTNMDFHAIAQYFDEIIFGGGAIIDDREWENSSVDNTSLYNILIKLSMCAINLKKEIVLLGLSTTDKFSNKDYLNNLQIVFNNAKYVSLRDTNSLNTLLDNNINCDDIQVIDDLVYALPNENTQIKHEQDKFSIGMVLVSYTDLKILKDMMKQIEDYMINDVIEENKEIVLIPFYDYQAADVNKYREILDSIEINDKISVKILPYCNNYEKIVKEFKSCNLLVAMRYHASLIALKENVPAVHVIYDIHGHYKNKMNYLLDKYDAKVNSISLSKYDGTNFLNVLKNLQEINEYEISTNFDEIFQVI